MSDYMPTTEDVRDSWLAAIDCCGASTDEDAQEFDRWYTEVMRSAKDDALRKAADDLASVPDYMPSEYDRGRVDQRHQDTEALYAMLSDEALRKESE